MIEMSRARLTFMSDEERTKQEDPSQNDANLSNIRVAKSLGNEKKHYLQKATLMSN
jgi:hypothetical protein